MQTQPSGGKFRILINLNSLAFVDIETTGGSAAARILEIGIIRVDNGTVTERYEQLLDPETPVPSFITNLTGIRNEMVENMPTFYSVTEKIQSLLENTVFIAHCVGFDYGFIRAEMKRIGYNFNMPRLCTRDLSRALFPDQKRHNLSTIIETHGLDPGSRHRALSDAEVLWQFWQKFGFNAPEGALQKAFTYKSLKKPRQSYTAYSETK